MSGSINAGYGSAALRGEVIANAQVAAQQVQTLTEQSSSGKISTTYGGLGAQAVKASLDLRATIANEDSVAAGITAATGPMGIAQASLKEITSIASSLKAKLTGIDTIDPASLDSLASWARAQLTQVANLLDTTDAGKYVFGGIDSANPPVPDPSSITASGFATGIAAAVATLGTSGAAATLASVQATAASNVAGTSPFSAFLNAAATTGTDVRTTVETGDTGALSERVPAGIVANTNADSVSSVAAGSSGGYMRDILASLASVAALGSSHANDPGLINFVQGTLSTVTDAIAASGVDAGVLGDRQTTLTNHAEALASDRTAMESQISNFEDVDLAKTATELSAAQTQLQASYKLLAGLNALSLVNFL